jgi:phage terminase large subunit
MSATVAQKLTPEILARIAAPFSFMVERYQRRPLDFLVAVLGADPDPWQYEALMALQRGHTRLSIRSGHGVGKTTFLAWVLLWHACTRFPQKSVCTAPSADQLYDALWAELLMWLRRLPLGWQQLFHPTGDRLVLRSRPDESFVTARTSRQEQPEALQGVHSAFVLLIADEASGIPEAVFEAASGSMSTPGAITILTGNPTRSTGFFHKTQTSDADRWWTRRVSSEDSKRVAREFVEEMAQRYGRNSNAFRVRVLGEFPASQGDTLMGAEVVEQAMQRTISPNPDEAEIWGVDAARFGVDHSVLIKRRGFVVPEPPRSWVGLDTMQLTGVIVNEWNRIVYEPHRPQAIVVDSIGLGAGVEDRLAEQNLPVVGVNVAETPSVEGRFRRQRDELWQACADWFATRKPSLPWHDRLRDDLVGPTYSFTSDGRLVVESKAELRARGLPSPDYADALCLTFANAAQVVGMLSRYRWRQPILRRIKGAA